MKRNIKFLEEREINDIPLNLVVDLICFHYFIIISLHYYWKPVSGRT